MPRWPRGLHPAAGSGTPFMQPSRRARITPFEAYTSRLTRVPIQGGQNSGPVGWVGNSLSGSSATFLGGLGNWRQTSNCTVAPDNLGGMVMTATAAATEIAASAGAGQITTTGMPVLPGQTVYLQAGFRAATASRSCAVGALFYTAAGTQISPALFGTDVTDTTTGVTVATAQVTAPATAAYARMEVQVLSAGSVGEQHTVTAPYMSTSALTTVGASVQVGPQGIGTVWYPASVSVTTTTGALDTSSCDIYVGPGAVLAAETVIGTIFPAGRGVLAMALPPMPVGWYLTAVWSGAHIGDTATVNVVGAMEALAA